MNVLEIINLMSRNGHVNIHFSGKEWDNIDEKRTIELIHELQLLELNWYIIPLDIRDCPDTEEKSDKWFLKKLNEALSRYQFPHILQLSGTFDEILKKLDDYTDKHCILFIYPFRPLHTNGWEIPEIQKGFLSSIRRLIEMNETLRLSIIIVSSDPVSQYDLFPFSNLDMRHLRITKFSESGN